MMKIYDSSSGFDGVQQGGVVCIGNFDGLHAGHKDILTMAKNICPQGPLTVMTFEPHPLTVLYPQRAPQALSPIAMKTRLLQQAGADQLIIITDTLRFLNLSPRAFIEEFLVQTLRPAAVVEGPNFTFGYGRSGTMETLRQLGKYFGFSVYEAPFRQVFLEQPQQWIVCSSSAIRRLLEEGNVCAANTLLARPYRLVGKTVPGRGIGKTLGFATANIHPENQTIPAEGVYAGWVAVGDTLDEVWIAGAKRPAALSLGRAKTFLTDHPLLIEAHILEDNVENLYGKYLAMDFVGRIRPQYRFDSRQQLIDQIQADCIEIRRLLS